MREQDSIIMYVTRPLSLYKNNPSALSLPPPEGPNSGYLVLQDNDPRHFFGLFKDSEIRDFPFPQNKLHDVIHGETHYSVYFLPAINQPLSSNTYYAIKTTGKNKGKAYASSTDEEVTANCFCTGINDVEPRPLDTLDVYQQFKMSIYQACGNTGFLATSAASDGHPPWLLRSKGWVLYSETAKNFSLGEASGLDPRLRARLPDFNFSLSSHAPTPVVVGKWYCPFVFVKDVLTPKDQVKKSMFYEMTLEQQWERVFFHENESTASCQGNSYVLVDISVPIEFITVARKEATRVDKEDSVNKVVWFNSVDGTTSVGLSSLVVERMMWEEERAGWVPREERQAKVVKQEAYGGVGMWAKYGCYMLVERFVLKRMDGSVLFTYDFSHTHHIRSKWE